MQQLRWRFILDLGDKLYRRDLSKGVKKAGWVCKSCRQQRIQYRKQHTDSTTAQNSANGYPLVRRAYELGALPSQEQSIPLHLQRSVFLDNTIPSTFPATHGQELVLIPRKRLKAALPESSIDKGDEIKIADQSEKVLMKKAKALRQGKVSLKRDKLRYKQTCEVSPEHAATLRSQVNTLRSMLEDVIHSKKPSDEMLETIAQTYLAVLRTWYKYAVKTLSVHEINLSTRMTSRNGTLMTPHEWCIQLICRYGIRSKQRQLLFRFYQVLREKVPEFIPLFQQSIISAAVQEGDLHQAEIWTKRFLQDGNLNGVDFLVPLFKRLTMLPFGPERAVLLAEALFEKDLVSMDIVYYVCLGISKLKDASRVLIFVKRFSIHTTKFRQDQFVNILYQLLNQRHHQVVLDVYELWRSYVDEQRIDGISMQLRVNTIIYAIALRAALYHYRSDDHIDQRSSVRPLKSRQVDSQFSRQFAEIIHDMSKDGITIDPDITPALINGLAAAKEMDLAMQTARLALELDKQNERSPKIISTMCRILLDEGRQEEAKQLLMEESGSKETIEMHNLILRMTLDYNVNDSFSAPSQESFLRALQHYNDMPVEPDWTTTQIMMTGAMRLGDFEAALGILTLAGRKAGPWLWRLELVLLSKEIYKRVNDAVNGKGSFEKIDDLVALLKRVVSATIGVWKVKDVERGWHRTFKEIFTPRLLQRILGTCFLPLEAGARVDFDQGRRKMEGILSILEDGKVHIESATVEAVVKKAIAGRLLGSMYKDEQSVI